MWIIIVSLMPGTVMNVLRVIYLARTSTDDYMLGVATGSMIVYLVVIIICAIVLVKIRKKKAWLGNK